MKLKLLLLLMLQAACTREMGPAWSDWQLNTPTEYERVSNAINGHDYVFYRITDDMGNHLPWYDCVMDDTFHRPVNTLITISMGSKYCNSSNTTSLIGPFTKQIREGQDNGLTWTLPYNFPTDDGRQQSAYQEVSFHHLDMNNNYYFLDSLDHFKFVVKWATGETIYYLKPLN